MFFHTPKENKVFAQSTFNYVATGGVEVTTSPFNRTGFDVCYIINQEFEWGVGSYLSIDQRFNWDTGNIPLSWYQVNGKCTYGSNCQTTGVDPSDQACRGLQGQRFQRIMSARSISDLCTKLTQDPRPMKWKIDNIKKYSRPVYKTANEEDCDTLQDQSWCECSKCAEFCLVVDGLIPFGVRIGGGRRFSRVGMGGFTCSGVANSRIVPPRKVGEGGVSVGGKSRFKSSFWRFISSEVPPGIIINGVARHKSSAYQFIASGGIITTGTAGLVSSQWSPSVGGVLYLGGESSAVTRGNIVFIPDGVGLLVSSSAGAWGKDYHFVYVTSGGLNVGGSAEATANNRIAFGSGIVSVGGAAHFRSSGYRIKATGQLELGGACRVNYRHISQGGIIATGSAAIGYHYIPSGQIVVGGSADFISSSYSTKMSGGVALSGNASINYYSFIVKIGVITAITGVGRNVIDPYTEPIAVSSPIDIITNCGGYTVSPQIEIRHNLADNNLLSDFLIRSGNTIPDRVFLSYQKNSNVWKWNKHYYTTAGIWDLLIEFSCTDTLGDSELGQMVWKLNVVVLQAADGVTKRTRFSTAFDADTVRLSTGIIGLEVAFNVLDRSIRSTAKTSKFLVFEDKIGLFSSWQQYPELKFYISEINTPSWLGYEVFETIRQEGFPTGDNGTLLTGRPWTVPPVGTAAYIMGQPPNTTSTSIISTVSIFEASSVPIDNDVQVSVGASSKAKKSPYEKITRQKEKAAVPLVFGNKSFRIFNK